MDSWLSYWSTPNKSYVSERHKGAHYDVVFAGVVPYLAGRCGVVLDWGCGHALAAGRIAEQCSIVFLYDAAESIRKQLHERYDGHPRIRVLDKSELDDLTTECIDLIVVNSVIQYLSDAQLSNALTLFYRLIRPSGALLLGDVINPGTGNLRHATTFLRFAWQKGFLFSAITGLAQTFISPYRKLQRDVGLAAFADEEILTILEAHGFAAEKLMRNIAVSRHRSSYIARKPIEPPLASTLISNESEAAR
jgi:SAM-dependent methyltransferase